MPLLDKLREQYGVGPVCSELHIAPSTYYHCQQQRHHPDKRSARAQHDDWLKREIQRVYDENHQVYGVRKVWRQLLRRNQGGQMYSGTSHGGYGTCRCSPG
ncbi:putative Transposase for IS629 [Escherichia coli DEC4C]|nr:putative Transposase for IS629 [Escherichia coli DEC4C]